MVYVAIQFVVTFMYLQLYLVLDTRFSGTYDSTYHMQRSAVAHSSTSW